MSLIIALILIIIVCTLTAKDKSKSEAYERRRNIEKEAVGKWESLYVDKELEKRLICCISEKDNYVAIYDEVSKVLANMEYWKYMLDLGFPLNEDQITGVSDYKQARKRMQENQSVALDIMLANRGKVSSWASSYGYVAYVRKGTTLLKESYYEYAETILNILRSKGAHVELLYIYNMGSENYKWKGSFGDRFKNDDYTTIKPFDRSPFKTTSLPPIE